MTFVCLMAALDDVTVRTSRGVDFPPSPLERHQVVIDVDAFHHRRGGKRLTIN